MKKLLFITFSIFLLLSCKKTEFSPEGPTDIRIRNMSDQTFTQVIVRTSEFAEDVDTIGSINPGATSEYFRFKKSYPKIEISAKVNTGGSIVSYSTGTVDRTYLQYLGQDKVTYVVYISNPQTRLLAIDDVIIEEALVLK